MSTLDEIYIERLERIRNGIDFYLEQAFQVNATSSAQVPVQTAEKIGAWRDSEKEISFGIPAQLQRKESRKTETIPIPGFLRKNSSYKGIDKVLDQKKESFSELLLRMIDEKGLKDSDVYKNANIDRRLFSKIRGDVNYMPSKKTAISFCLALQLEMDEAEELLEAAGYSFSRSARFDLIIRYLIENKEYNIHFVNIVLDDYGEGTLSK